MQIIEAVALTGKCQISKNLLAKLSPSSVSPMAKP